MLAVLGCGYVLVSMVLGHLDFGDGGDGGHAADHGGGGGDYGVEGHGHGSVSTSGVGLTGFHFPFFSPLAVATLLGATGAYGLIAKFGLAVSDNASLYFAIPAAVLTTYGVTYVGWRLVVSSRGSSQIRIADLCGARAEVITPIPAGGVGEVAALVCGQRYNSAARECEGREVPRGTTVTVEEMVGTTLVVRRQS